MRPRVAFLIWTNSFPARLKYFVALQSIADKLADVTTRIVDSELRLAEQQGDIARGNCVLYSATSTLRELRPYKARLEDLIAVRALDQCP